MQDNKSVKKGTSKTSTIKEKKLKNKTESQLQLEESKHLKEGINKLTQVMAAIVRKKMKIVDLIIAILIVANIAIGFTANNYFTGMNFKCLDNKNETQLSSFFTDEKIINSIFYDCSNNCYRKSFTNTSEIDVKKGNEMP